MINTWALFVLALVSCLHFQSLEASQSVQLTRGSEIRVAGRNYGFPFGEAFLFVNPRGLSKTSLLAQDAQAIPANWTARFGSVTINQFGQEHPAGGVNEAGLVIEGLGLSSAAGQYPESDQRPTLNELQWIQYQLDRYCSVSEALKHLDDLRIVSMVKPLQYFLYDRSGATAVIHYQNGRWAIHQGQPLSLPILANETYDVMTAFLSRYEGLYPLPAELKDIAPLLPIPQGDGGLERLTQAASRIAGFDEKNESYEDTIWDALTLAEQRPTPLDPNATQWTVVYDLKRNLLSFRTRGRSDVTKVPLSRLDYGCRKDPLILDIHGDRKLRVDVGNRRMHQHMAMIYQKSGMPPKQAEAAVGSYDSWQKSLECSRSRRP